MAATSVAENLVESWLLLDRDPANQQNLNTFGKELDTALRRKLPNGTFRGLLQGLEEDIRQNTAIELLHRFFAGNQRLAKATSEGNRVAVANELDRSMSLMQRFIRHRLIKQKCAERKMLEEFAEDLPRRTHVRPRGSFWQLPYPARHTLTLRMLQIAIEERQITKNAGSLAIEMLTKQMSQSEIARERGVSRAAVNQSLKSIRGKMVKMTQTLELPPQ